MVEIRIREDGRNRLSSFFASGHADWAEDGKDVVCAAVSAILQAAWLGLSEVSHVDVIGTRQKTGAKGILELAWPEASRDDAGVKAIVTTAALSIERIAMQYPNHIRAIREASDG
jgi:uncharacterized protein YsxB (DUF464 family)